MTADDRSSDGAESSGAEALRQLLRAIRADVAASLSRMLASGPRRARTTAARAAFVPGYLEFSKFAVAAFVLALLVVSAGILWVTARASA